MGIDQRNGIIKGAKTRKVDDGSLASGEEFTIHWEVNNLTPRKGSKSRFIWYRLQTRGWRDNPAVPAANERWIDVIPKARLARGNGDSGTVEWGATTGAGSRSSLRQERFPEFRFVVTRKSGAGKRNYCVYADLVPKR